MNGSRQGGFDTAQGRVALEKLPLDLHGHRKKLAFIWSCIEKYRRDHSVSASRIRVLEVGCSNGRNIATPLASGGYMVTGIDIHPESIEYARANTPFPNARFLCRNLSEIPRDEQFEIVILSDVLEHVDDPVWLCETSMQFLAPTGLVLISIPNGYGPYEIEQRLLRHSGLDRAIGSATRKIGRLLRRPSSLAGRPVGGPAYNYDSGHVQFFHLRDFHRLLDRVGLTIVETANGALFGGTLSGLLLGRFQPVVSASLRLADWLPQRWVTTWYFCCSVKQEQLSKRSGPE